MSAGDVTAYALRAGGGRNLGLTVSGIQVLLSPPDEARQVEAEGLADLLLEKGRVLARLKELEEEASTLRDHLRRAREAAASADARAIAATAGRRRFFGPVLLRAAREGEWAGEVWLLDPSRKERGAGLRFSSLAEVRLHHPELWVVGASADGVMLDAWGEP